MKLKILLHAIPHGILGCIFLLLETSPLSAQKDSSSAESSLGTTMTVDQLLGKKPVPNNVSKPDETVLSCEAVSEPSPTFKYRFAPHPVELRVGSAYLHFSRAIIMYSQVPDTARRQWNKFMVDNDDDMGHAKAIGDQLRPFQSVLKEMQYFATAEDMAWDHRIRDEKGPRIYEVLLPEVQSARDIARLIKYQAIDRLQQHDFAGAFQSIKTGYRLSEFLQSGETLVQQLVGLAIEAIMRDVIQVAIQTPGCPNLYWALSTVQHSDQSLIRAIEIETKTIGTVFSVLDHPEVQEWDQATWQKKWQATAAEFTSLQTMSSDRQSQVSAIIALETFVGLKQAKKRLIESGIDPNAIEKMCPEQIVAIDTKNEILRLGDTMKRSVFVPYHLSRKMSEENEKAFNQWRMNNAGKSMAATIADLLLPAVNQARVAFVRSLSNHNRLMTVEAIRAYAAAHHGELPKSIDLLEPLPALQDPFSNQLFTYAVSTEDGVPTATLTNGDPTTALRTIKIRIAK